MKPIFSQLRKHMAESPNADCVPYPARPDGRLIWVHAADMTPSVADLTALLGLRAALLEEGEGAAHLLLTGDAAAPPRVGNILRSAPPAEDTEAVARFLHHWRPDWSLWLGLGAPIAARGLHDSGRKAAIFLPSFPREHPLHRSTLSCFTTILTADATISAALNTRMPAPDLLDIRTVGPLAPVPAIPPVDPTLLDQTVCALAGRPIWLIAGPQRQEAPVLVAACRQAARQSRRLLTVICCDPADSAFWQAAYTDMEWQVTTRQQDATPGDRTDVFVTGAEGDTALWMRLATVTWLGGTLPVAEAPTGPSVDPLVAAALGSALIAGPRRGAYAATLARLALAGAVRTVPGPEALAAALSDTLPPAVAARHAAAGWQVSSEGAPLLHALRHALFEALDTCPPAGQRDD